MCAICSFLSLRGLVALTALLESIGCGPSPNHDDAGHDTRSQQENDRDNIEG